MSEVEQKEELLRQSQLPPSDLLIKGIREFNAGAYFEQHETLETAWRNENGPIRRLYQGILQIGVAFYQIQRSNYAGAIRMFQRASQYLDDLPAVCQGVNVAELRTNAAKARAELERLGPDRIGAFNQVLFKPIQIVNHE
ncbi:MAG: DUF309 domain-containing protein [Chloroflexi bacterium]|nr:DUF309 domain-containing protein [Chloroflexota bacterium]MCL5273816.1 DUF309 domain-containing protein [Chloroflexota bacterium]